MNAKKPSPEREKEQEKEQEKALEKKEIGGFADCGLKEPTRYGDWDVNGRCSDF